MPLNEKLPPHQRGSFDYKTINKNIKHILDIRSQLNNTVQVAMPFVKATATLQHDTFLGKGNMGFTLGAHAINEDVAYEDLYYSRFETGKNGPLVGYTYRFNGNIGVNQKIYAVAPPTDVDLFFGTPMHSDYGKVPPPGITSLTVGTNKNGVISSAKLNISVPTLVQLEYLHRTFLVPGIGMVLEWGQLFAPTPDALYVDPNYTSEKDPIMPTDKVSRYGQMKATLQDFMFPWYKKAELTALLDRLASKTLGVEDILTCYVYPTQGQYMWMFGRIASFSTRAQSDGSFSCDITIIGPNEDGWAYQTRNTVVPRADASKQICLDNSRSIETFFSTATAGDDNFRSLLEKVTNPNNNHPWKNHVVKIINGNKAEGDTTLNESTATAPQNSSITSQNKAETPARANVDQTTFAEVDDAYYMTWRFFVNVVLNSETEGIKSLLNKAGLVPSELKRIGLLRPYTYNSLDPTSKEIADAVEIDDENESFVGSNKYLRSVDPGAVIIVNETAVEELKKEIETEKPPLEIDIFPETELSKQMRSLGDFYNNNTIQKLAGTSQNSSGNDRGFLSTGVWLNHKAIVECMVSGDTLIRGISRLLERMNQATSNFWQLTLDSVEGNSQICPSPDTNDLVVPVPYNFTIVDANHRETSTAATSRFLDNVHTFHRYIQESADGNLVGSELIDCSVDLSLPKRLFSQIAIMGLVRDEEAKKTLLTEQQPDTEAATPIFGDPSDERYRKMFALLSLEASPQAGGKSPDLTIPTKEKREQQKQCKKPLVQTPANAAGNKDAPGGKSVDTRSGNQTSEVVELNKQKVVAVTQYKNLKCEECGVVLADVNSNPATRYPPKTKQQLIQDAKVWQTTLRQDLRKTYGSADDSDEFGIRENDFLIKQGLSNDSALEFVHTANSAHYTDNAFDIPVRGTVPEPGNSVIYWWRSRGYYVIDERPTKNPSDKSTGSHIHVQYNLSNEEVVQKASAVSGSAQTQGQCAPNILDKCKKLKDEYDQLIAKISELDPMSANASREMKKYPYLQTIYRYHEMFRDHMVAKITNDANDDSANPFGAAPGTLSITADLTMLGINGLRVGELFWIDRIPSFYRIFGAFQIMSIEQKIQPGSWTTSVHSRFNYLGRAWRNAMLTKVQTDTVTRVLNRTNITVPTVEPPDLARKYLP